MPVVSLARVQKRVIELLTASPRSRYSGIAADNSRYPSTQEITDAIIETDLIICRDIIETAGHPYAEAFMQASDPLAHGTLIPAFIGVVADVYVDGALSSVATSRDEILEIRNSPSLYPNISAQHFIENSVLYHTGDLGVVWRPMLVKDDAACQAPEAYTEGDIVGTISLLAKDGAVSGDAFYQYHDGLFQRCRQSIRGKVLVIPESQQFEMRAA